MLVVCVTPSDVYVDTVRYADSRVLYTMSVDLVDAVSLLTYPVAAVLREISVVVDMVMKSEPAAEAAEITVLVEDVLIVMYELLAVT